MGRTPPSQGFLSLSLHSSWAFSRSFHNSVKLLSSMKRQLIWLVNSKDWAHSLISFATKWFGDHLYRLSIRHTIVLAETLKPKKAYYICLSLWVQRVPPYDEGESSMQLSCLCVQPAEPSCPIGQWCLFWWGLALSLVFDRLAFFRAGKPGHFG